MKTAKPLNAIPPVKGLNVESQFSSLSGRRVSQWSFFGADEWRLSGTHTIYWSKPPKQYPAVDQTAFKKLMRPVKLLAYFLLTEESLKAITVYIIVCNLKEFAAWMLTRRHPVRRFCEIKPYILERYFEHLSKRQALNRRKKDCAAESKTLGLDALRHKSRALARLYDYRERLGDGLCISPVGMLDSTSLERYQQDARASKTPPIPNDDHQILLGAAVDFINFKAAGILKALRDFTEEEKVIQIKEALEQRDTKKVNPKKVGDFTIIIKRAIYGFRRGVKRYETETQLSVINLAKEAGVPLSVCIDCLCRDRTLKQLYRSRRRIVGDNINWDDSSLNRDLRLLQIACFIVIASSTGMRAGELIAIKPGCLVKRKIRRHEGFLYWLRSKLLKTSPHSTGELAFWLCGELAAHAINILEKLHALLPSTLAPKQTRTIPLEDSLFRAYSWNAITLEARPMLAGTVQSPLDFFIQELNLKVSYVFPHQFRRTFARNVILWSQAPMLALKRHFKHWSLLMTDYYIGMDDQLVEMFFEEQKNASRERLRQILAGECGGPGGLISQKRLAKMADLEELPVNFRGKEREGKIGDLLDDLSEEGVIAYKCGEFTTCVYVPGLAKCGEGGPKEHECHPTECPNSHILLEDVPFYLNNIRQNQAVYDELSVLERAGPYGNFLLERIQHDTIAVMPLANLYAAKLQQLRDYYEQLGETDKVGSYGLLLRDRIVRDSETLRKVTLK
jgi:integrase